MLWLYLLAHLDVWTLAAEVLIPDPELVAPSSHSVRARLLEHVHHLYVEPGVLAQRFLIDDARHHRCANTHILSASLTQLYFCKTAPPQLYIFAIMHFLFKLHTSGTLFFKLLQHYTHHHTHTQIALLSVIKLLEHCSSNHQLYTPGNQLFPSHKSCNTSS